MHLRALSLCLVFFVSALHITSGNLFGSIKSIQHQARKHTPVHLPQASSTNILNIMKNRGGSATVDTKAVSEPNSDASNEKWSMRKNMWKNVLGVWGVVQVVSILANAIKRLYPIAIQPFLQKDMETYHWVMYVAWALYMGYAEGYKAFQLKFSPMVVSRAFNIAEKPTILNCILAGPYSMGLFGASRKRMIVSWCITAGVFSLVKVVKMLPYPYRSIVDAGVVVGLSYGTLSIVVLASKALMGGKVMAPDEEEVAAPKADTKQQ